MLVANYIGLVLMKRVMVHDWCCVRVSCVVCLVPVWVRKGIVVVLYSCGVFWWCCLVNGVVVVWCGE